MLDSQMNFSLTKKPEIYFGKQDKDNGFRAQWWDYKTRDANFHSSNRIVVTTRAI